MIQVTLKVYLQVDHKKNLTKQQAEDAAEQAVRNALKQVEGMGFAHSAAPEASVGFAGVDVVSSAER